MFLTSDVFKHSTGAPHPPYMQSLMLSSVTSTYLSEQCGGGQMSGATDGTHEGVIVGVWLGNAVEHSSKFLTRETSQDSR